MFRAPCFYVLSYIGHQMSTFYEKNKSILNKKYSDNPTLGNTTVFNSYTTSN